MENIHYSGGTTTELPETEAYTYAPAKTDIGVDIPAEPLRSGQWQCIFRVPQHLRGDKNRRVYDPVVLSLGPYHHGKPKFHRTEVYKEKVLNLFVSASVARDVTKDRDFFHKQMLKSINEIRSNYEEVGYADEELAEIILRDACFIIHFMEAASQTIITSLGMSTVAFMNSDFFMLENQIPLWIIKRLHHLGLGRHLGVEPLGFDERLDTDTLAYEYASIFRFGEHGLYGMLGGLPEEDKEHQHLHLLEAARSTLIRPVVAEECNKETEPCFLAKILKWKYTPEITIGGNGSISSRSKTNNTKIV